jgi:hypothetical protein
MLQQMTPAVRGILIANVLFFILTLSLGDFMYGRFSLWFMENPRFGFWQFATHMFMHGGFAHILFNMYAVVAFGTPLERQWGQEKFIFFFFSAGLGAAFLHTGVNYIYFNSAVEAIVDSGISRVQLFEALTSTSGVNLSYIERGVSYEVCVLHSGSRSFRGCLRCLSSFRLYVSQRSFDAAISAISY